MDHNGEMGLKVAVTALRNALLNAGVLSQGDIDDAVGDIFAKMALDKALGARADLLNAYNVAVIEDTVRSILHPGYREERS